jgi:hypothetical protein
MLGFNGGLIGVRRDPNNASAPGIWLPNEVSVARSVNRWPIANDPFYSDVSILLPFDGSNGAQVAPDGGPNGVITTFNSTAQLSTAQARWGTASLRINGGTEWVNIPGSALLNFPGDFTVESWVRMNTANSGLQTVIEIGDYINGVLIRSSGNTGDVWINNTNLGNIANFFTSNTWGFIQVAREGVNARVAVDGTTRLTATITGTVNTTSAAARIGYPRHTGGQQMFGFIDDLRITKGVARANTVPEGPFPGST